jgi:hypothetical protein
MPLVERITQRFKECITDMLMKQPNLIESESMPSSYRYCFRIAAALTHASINRWPGENKNEQQK